jgi:soluble lytic murein transglycosylase-like protein
MQLIPATAERFSVTDIFDPKQNIYGGTEYLRYLLDLFNGDTELALAGYNAGENAVKKYDNQIPPYKETQNYVKKVMKFWEYYR